MWITNHVLQVPDKYRWLLDKCESIPWRRRNYEKHAFFRELLERAEDSSTSSFEYTRHLKRHERGIKLIKAQKSQKSFSGSQFFSGSMAHGLGGQQQRWIFRVKVLFIIFIFFSSYKTFQNARDGLKGSQWFVSQEGEA